MAKIKNRKWSLWTGKTISRGQSQRPPISKAARQPMIQWGRPIVKVTNEVQPGGFDCDDVAACPAVTDLDSRVTVLEWAWWEANTASNIWGWAGVFDSKVWVDLQMKSLVAWANITLNESATEIEIVASGWAIGTDELVKVTSNDTTPGYLLGKVVAGTNIVKTELNDWGNETLEIKTSDSPTFTNLTVTDTANFWDTVNFTDTTLNYDNVIQNFLWTPNQISCEVTPSFATPYTAPALTQYAEVIINYDNTVDPIVTKTIKTALNGSTQIISFVTPTDTWEITISWAAGDITVTITGWTPWFFTFDVTNPICYYNGVSVNNYTSKIHIHNGDITENTNTYESNVGVTEVYDSTSNITNEGNTTLNNVTINGTLTGGATPGLLGSLPFSLVATAVPVVLAVPPNTTWIWIVGRTLISFNWSFELNLRKWIVESNTQYRPNQNNVPHSFVWSTGWNTLTIGGISTEDVDGIAYFF